MTKPFANEYIQFLQRIIIQKAYFVMNETESYDIMFNKLHVLLEYLYDIIYKRADAPITPYELESFHNNINSYEQVYVRPSFDDYMISLLAPIHNKTRDLENVITYMKDTTYMKNMYSKYQKHYEMLGLKNWLVHEITNQEKDVYINSIPYLEYKSLYLYDESMLNMNEIHSISLEQQAHKQIDTMIGI
jgi:hypothetical protein